MRQIQLSRIALIPAFCLGTITAVNASPVTAPVTAPTEKSAAPTPTQATAPDALLSAATTIVTNRLKQSGPPNTVGAASIDDLLETTILPLFDFRRMTQLAVARHWKLATPAQQDALVAEFKTLLVRTYYAALVNYREEVIEYKPLTLPTGKSDVTVKSTVKKPGVARMSIDYDMEKLEAGWKVYDIRIGGISLTSNYRSSFTEIITNGGVDELIRVLATKNRQARSGASSDQSEARGLILLYGLAPSLLRGPH